MNVNIREFKMDDLSQMIEIWNEVVDEGIAFPQEELLNMDTGKSFFKAQTYTAVAEGKVYLITKSAV